MYASLEIEISKNSNLNFVYLSSYVQTFDVEHLNFYVFFHSLQRQVHEQNLQKGYCALVLSVAYGSGAYRLSSRSVLILV